MLGSGRGSAFAAQQLLQSPGVALCCCVLPCAVAVLFPACTLALTRLPGAYPNPHPDLIITTSTNPPPTLILTLALNLTLR